MKFGHVTFFWNGNRSGYFNPDLEKYEEIPSDIGIPFNEQPKMKALEIAQKARDVILSRKFDQVRVNIANGDMVGHTGDIEATIVGCKAADEAVKVTSHLPIPLPHTLRRSGKLRPANGMEAERFPLQIILDAIEQVGGIFVLTADHGNAEDMAKRDKSGKPLRDKDGKVQTLTSHTLNPVSALTTKIVIVDSSDRLLVISYWNYPSVLQVPIAIGGPGLAPGVRFRTDLKEAGLANVAATVMNLHGFEAPDHYEPTLIEVLDKWHKQQLHCLQLPVSTWSALLRIRE